MIKRTFSVIMTAVFLTIFSPVAAVSEAAVIPADATSVKSSDQQPKKPALTQTLDIMAEYDYAANSVTGLSTGYRDREELKKELAGYGTLYGEGMSYKDYIKAMEYEWTDCTDYYQSPVTIDIDITKTMDYYEYVAALKKISRYEGVYLYKIGESQEGRNIYCIEINVEPSKEKKVIMLTGQVHAREFAGGTYLVKMFADLIQKAQKDKKTLELLENYKFVAVPIINVDGREALIDAPKEWTTASGLWKAYINGTDGNRNFPGVLWGEVSKGNSLKWNIRTKPGCDNYAGDHAGNCPETQALMKFLYHYTVVEKAECLIDLHQQGSGIYAGKEWTTAEQEESAESLRAKVLKFLNEGNESDRVYTIKEDEPSYGFNGTGSSVTDYAVSVACGAKFSPAFGFSVFTDGKREYTLMELNNLDNADFEVSAPNPGFSTLTIEIGYGADFLGNSALTRKLLAKEYQKYHFNKLFEALPDILGEK